MADKPDPSRVSHRFAEVQPAYQLVDALFGGTATMRAAGSKYLPKNDREADEDWTIRVQRSTLFNVYKRSIQQAAARLFGSDVVLTGYPVEVVVWSADADAQGRDITQFSKSVFIDALNRGVAFILVEFPERTEQPATLADALVSGDRPYWVGIEATQVLAAHSKLIAGAERLTHFRFKETVLELSDDGLEEVLVEQIKAFYQAGPLEPVTWQTWRYDKIKGWEPFSNGTLQGVPAIPAVPVYTNRIGYCLGSPPLIDLAYLNVTHFQSASEQRNILHISRVPFLHINGWEKEYVEDPVTKMQVPADVEVSIHRALITDSPQASAKWVETNGQALTAGFADLVYLEQKMEKLGLMLSTPKSGNITATETAVSAAEANSMLKDMAKALSDSLEYALYLTGFYLDTPIPESARVVVDTSFAVDLVTKEPDPNARPKTEPRTAQVT
jgi:hypothetical protein